MARSLTSDELEQVALLRDLLRSGTAEQMRESAGILRSEVARCVPCHASAVARWEKAERVPRPDVALTLASLYGRFASLASRDGATR